MFARALGWGWEVGLEKIGERRRKRSRRGRGWGCMVSDGGGGRGSKGNSWLHDARGKSNEIASYRRRWITIGEEIRHNIGHSTGYTRKSLCRLIRAEVAISREKRQAETFLKSLRSFQVPQTNQTSCDFYHRQRQTSVSCVDARSNRLTSSCQVLQVVFLQVLM